MFAFVRCACAVHSPSLPDEVTESTTHCAKTETSRRYNSCTSQYTTLFIDIPRIDASCTCSKQYQQGPTCLSAFDVNTITLITKPLPLRFQPNNGKNYHTPDIALRGKCLQLDTHALTAQEGQHRLYPSLQTQMTLIGTCRSTRSGKRTQKSSSTSTTQAPLLSLATKPRPKLMEKTTELRSRATLRNTLVRSSCRNTQYPFTK